MAEEEKADFGDFINGEAGSPDLIASFDVQMISPKKYWPRMNTRSSDFERTLSPRDQCYPR